MKKFKKPLIINLPEDDNETLSPKNKYPQNKERPLLILNEHTITSSTSNNDELVELDEHHLTVEEFSQFNSKGAYDQKNNQNEDNYDSGNNKRQKYKKFNVIEFEEFSIDDEKEKQKTKPQNETSNQSYGQNAENNEKRQSKMHRRQFSIQIPQNEQKQQRKQISTKISNDSKSENRSIRQSNSMKQPPAPSNKAKLQKALNRHFIFPANDEQLQTISKAKIQKTSSKFISEEQHEFKLKQLTQEWTQKVQILNKSFQKERQQFYKEKSNLQKDLMIKDGQIQMLQRLITNRYSPKQSSHSSNNNSSNHQSFPDKHQYKAVFNTNIHSTSSHNNNPNKIHSFHGLDEKLNSMETILLEKDLQINSLLQKINQLNLNLEKKNSELEELKLSLMKSNKLNESLGNEIFLYQKKDKSEKLTKDFFKMKQALTQFQQQQSLSKTPTGYNRNRWPQDSIDKKQPPVKQRSPQKQHQYPLRGIDDLHKRLQSLKMNRIQLQNRGRIKSELGYPQTSKNKTKSTFDFKGKFYEERSRDYGNNNSRLY